jgi:Ca2+:H+ antiporter
MKPSIYWLLAFVPITVILEHAGKVPPPVIFFSAALAIVPIAVLIVRSTEQIAAHRRRCGRHLLLASPSASTLVIYS